MRPPRPKPIFSRRAYRGCSPYLPRVVRPAMPWEIRRMAREAEERQRRAAEEFIASIQRAHIEAVEACKDPDCPVHHPKDVPNAGMNKLQ